MVIFFISFCNTDLALPPGNGTKEYGVKVNPAQLSRLTSQGSDLPGRCSLGRGRCPVLSGVSGAGLRAGLPGSPHSVQGAGGILHSAAAAPYVCPLATDFARRSHAVFAPAREPRRARRSTRHQSDLGQ
eukprot:m.813826 g.813826  ORF g.813826 m.813826 type:complete len:129 (-) comp59362_c0_seq3:1777-2163(-)